MSDLENKEGKVDRQVKIDGETKAGEEVKNSKKRLIRLRVLDWWNNNFEDNCAVDILKRFYEVEECFEPEKLDLLICSVFGVEHQRDEYRDVKKLLVIGEHITPDFNEFDYAIGFDYITFDKRYVQCTISLLGESGLLANKKHEGITEDMFDRKFASFVVSNKCANERNSLFTNLSKYKPILSGGKFANNLPNKKPVVDKMGFLKATKFNIAYENTSGHGYITEKIIDAFSAKTVPIYWGDPYIGKDGIYNPKSFINAHDFQNEASLIEYIKEVDNNKDLYLSMLKEPAFLDPNYVINKKREVEAFICGIIEEGEVYFKDWYNARQDYFLKNLVDIRLSEYNNFVEYRRLINGYEKLKQNKKAFMLFNMAFNSTRVLYRGASKVKRLFFGGGGGEISHKKMILTTLQIDSMQIDSINLDFF
ncbi:glycosyltransferase family 10 [Helicobacter sp. 11S02629-2]|uniref:glycosyltransferase family 10 domain-containing protein n=1 Tax=Helicobacter sp. 11S02629-2 TaxID=1476195 RepID=UPI000BA66A8C|nr:glycosyltransferase family 10 [Helicobacter sp. 11S02629-2]PAF45848.1 hypothetical protein BKH40_00070 [Helicobacter sp. 11S02629-2]